MAILAGIAFDTLPLVYNVPSFERTTMRHFCNSTSWAIVHSRWHLHWNGLYSILRNWYRFDVPRLANAYIIID